MAEYKYNLLIDELPTTLQVGGSSFSINTDFRFGLMFNQCLDDDELDEQSKMLYCLKIGYKDEIPDDIYEGFRELVKFYSCMELDGKDFDKEMESCKKKIEDNSEDNDEYMDEYEYDKFFDYDKDCFLIYSTFLQVYHIDLIDTSMHWYKFVVLLRSLFDENNLTKVVQFRTMKIDSKLTPDMKKYYMNMKKHYSLDKMTDAEKDEYKKEMLEKWG